MSNLKDCYDQMKLIIGDSIESYESVYLIEKIRQFWKPKKVRVILLAESHVFTTERDRSIQLRVIDELPSFPKDYAKFVYCLAYGESELTKSQDHPKRDGTPQFWKIFYSCLNLVSSNADFSDVLKSKVPFEQRILNKIILLKSLQEKGVWLIDTSICALYNGGIKPDNNTMNKAITTSWLNYTKNVIQEANPEYVIVIGKGVAKSVESDLKVIMGERYKVIDQPNAHLSADKHLENYRTYFNICNNL